MTEMTRRSLLGGAALGSMALAACAGAPTQRYRGEAAFLHGVASGDPLPGQVILWTRVTPLTGAGSIPVRWEIREEGDDGLVASGLTQADEGHDFCVKVDAAGLVPGRTYTYRFIALTEQGEVMSPSGRLRTPRANGDDPVRLAVISCSNWQFGFFNAYRALAEEADLDAIIHLGDYIYEYGIDGYGRGPGPDA